MRQRLDSEEKVMFGDGKKEMDIWKRVRKWREVGVVWEQPLKAEERERPVVTTPGFSFSAAGLLFPYHLGVAKLLIEKGYIKVHKLRVKLFYKVFLQLGSFVFDPNPTN
ncbi:putative patatin-like phospholipase domain-containing protein [Helianthus annuus]|nr:putative patatin-like phospholipase domain-containing protein [Helianthus annuus]KAJ0574391.1 putative patatin-like phospholipase domain-containing protein [Helianthus annuus]KAJ0738726.1 putative patatin-like phospholipase domain-containing protein [Helianthus annuus]